MDPDSRWHKGLLVGLIGLVLALIVQQPLVYSAPTELQPFVLSSQANLGTACLADVYLYPGDEPGYQNDGFGYSVAVEGNTIVVGMYGYDRPNEILRESGVVYIYERQPNGSLQQQTILEASDFGQNDLFGRSVAIQGDTLVVSASGYTGPDESLESAGAVYIFERQADGTWLEQAILQASNAGTRDYFGNHIAIDGDTLVVGASRESGDDNSIEYSGAVYVFERQQDHTWLETAYLKASNAEYNDGFGVSVDIDDNILVVGTPYEDSLDNTLQSAGAAYIFERQPNGSWIEKKILRSSISSAQNYFGEEVAVYGDRIAVAAPYAASIDTSLAKVGLVFVYKRNTNNDWVYEQTLQADNTDPNDNFGSSIVMEGNQLIIGADGEDGAHNELQSSGAVYVFNRTNDGWNQQAILRASNATSYNYFGRSVAFDSTTVVVGATGKNGPSNTNQRIGAAYAFRLDLTPQIEVGEVPTLSTLEIAPLNALACDPHGAGLSYWWNQTSGPTAQLNNPTRANPILIASDDPGTLTFDVTVTNAFGITATETLSITVENQLPVADAGPTQQVLGRSLVTLDATASYDPDNDALGYEWIQLEGSTVVLSDASSMKPSFTAPNETTSLTFQLTVTDEFAGTSVTTTTVNIEQSRNIFLPFLARER